MNIKLLRLVSGEFVISEIQGCQEGEELSDFTDDWVVLLNPRAIVPVQNESGHGMGLAPLSPFSDCAKIPIHRSHVMFMDTPDVHLATSYASEFGGIITPPTPKLDLSGLSLDR